MVTAMTPATLRRRDVMIRKLPTGDVIVYVRGVGSYLHQVTVRGAITPDVVEDMKRTARLGFKKIQESGPGELTLLAIRNGEPNQEKFSVDGEASLESALSRACVFLGIKQF